MSRVICDQKRWKTVQTVNNDPPTILPVYGRVYTIEKMEYFHKWNTWGITLKELEPNQFFELDAFLPLDESFPEWVEHTLLPEAEFENAVTQMEMP